MMNKNELKSILNKNKKLIDDLIVDYFKSDKLIDQAMLYAAEGGKKIRACLYLECKKMFSQDISKDDLKFALALELIHAYSLVHDDLPSMDDDDFRRGKLSLHKKYGEDIAVLAGDALLNEAALILFDLSIKNPTYLKSSSYVLKRSSKTGMILGQVLDLKRPKSYDLDYLLEVYSKKTSDLFKASCVSAAILSTENKEDIAKIEAYAENLGLAFQIQDDLLEKSYDDELNILNIASRPEAEKILARVNDKAREQVKDFKNNMFLLSLIDYLTERSY